MHADRETKRQADVLFTSLEGASALVVLLPLIRELAQHIAGRAPCPHELRELPKLMLAIAVERARYRAAKARGDIRD